MEDTIPPYLHALHLSDENGVLTLKPVCVTPPLSTGGQEGQVQEEAAGLGREGEAGLGRWWGRAEGGGGSAGIECLQAGACPAPRLQRVQGAHRPLPPARRAAVRRGERGGQTRSVGHMDTPHARYYQLALW